MTPRTASLPVGPCRQGYRKERMEADSTRSRLPAVPPNEKIVQYQQGTAPLLPALSQVADMRPFRTDWPEGFYGDACVPRQTAVPALDADLHRAAEPSLPNPSHGHQTTTKISDSFTEQSHYNLQVIMAIELRDNSCALSCNLFLPSP